MPHFENNYSHHCLQDGYVNPKQADMLRASIPTLLALLRPDAVALVDAFDFPDVTLENINKFEYVKFYLIKYNSYYRIDI